MNAKFVLSTIILGLALAGVLMQTPVSGADPFIHRVQGHGVSYFINQISIDAWEDGEGVHGKVIWSSVVLPASPIGSGAQDVWIINVHTLIVSGNSAIVGGTIVFDNKTGFEGSDYYFLVTDNGSGAADPPDELGYWPQLDQISVGSPILGGNFVVE